MIPRADITAWRQFALRALYQRRKGRDLFDLWYASNAKAFNSERVIHSFHHYMKSSHKRVTNIQFMANILDKLTHNDFLRDTQSLILPEVNYDPTIAGKWCIENLISKID
jgi:predicted nucleotidyltransferase component of viral defense system